MGPEERRWLFVKIGFVLFMLVAPVLRFLLDLRGLAVLVAVPGIVFCAAGMPPPSGEVGSGSRGAPYEPSGYRYDGDADGDG